MLVEVHRLPLLKSLRIATVRSMFVALAWFVGICSSGCGGPTHPTAKAPIRVGLAHHPPFSEVRNGLFWGIDVDLARNLGATLEREVEFAMANESSAATRRWQHSILPVPMSRNRRAQIRTCPLLTRSTAPEGCHVAHRRLCAPPM